MINWIKSLFKKKISEGIYNLHHPEMAGKTEFAFECNGVKYYKAVKDYILPVGRYKFIDQKLSEAEIRMDLKTLKAFIVELEKSLDGSKGTINLGKAFETIYKMKTRCELAFEPETIKRLASVVYFDETEDLRDYDEEYGNKKIASWDKAEFIGFFLTKPIEELLNLRGISETSLAKYIKDSEQILKSLTLEQEKVSSENS